MPRYNSTIIGLREVVNNLNREIEQISGRSLRGMLKAVVLIRRETETGVRTPKDLGNLRHSFFTVTCRGSIQKGGGIHHTAEGNKGAFVGPKAGELAAGHVNMLSESKLKVNELATVYRGPFLIFGYSVNYAMYVHENIGAHFKARGSGPQWFQIAINKHRNNILTIIRNEAKIS